MIVVDASVALKWVVAEDGSEEAAFLSEEDLCAPDLLPVECANALWVKARRGELSAQEAQDGVNLLATAPIDWIPCRSLVQSAIELASTLDHPVYDCLYLAAALEREATLVTGDRRFSEAASGAFPGVLRLLKS